MDFQNIRWNPFGRYLEFGQRGKFYHYAPKDCVITFKTGSKPMEDVRLTFGSPWYVLGFGARIHAECVDPDGNAINTANMFLSEDGIDPKAGPTPGFGDFWKPGFRKPRTALKPNTEYALSLTSADKIKVNYYSLG